MTANPAGGSPSARRNKQGQEICQRTGCKQIVTSTWDGKWERNVACPKHGPQYTESHSRTHYPHGHPQARCECGYSVMACLGTNRVGHDARLAARAPPPQRTLEAFA